MKVNRLMTYKYKYIPKLTYHIESALFMELNEEDFKKIVYQLEHSELFERLKKYKVIKLKNFPKIRFYSSYYDLKEEKIGLKESFNIDLFLEGRERIIYLAKKFGKEKFKKYFLEGDFSDIDKIAKDVGLSVDEIKQLCEFMDDFFLHRENSKSLPEIASKHKFTKVAEIIKDGKKYEVKFSCPDFFKERYLINYSKLEEFKKQIPNTEKKQLNQFIKRLKLINMRKNLLYQVLKTIVVEQNKYFETMRVYDLKPLTIRELSRKLNVNPSSLSRLIKYKTVLLPSGQEKELKFFLPNRKKILKEYIKDIFRIKGDKFSSQDLKNEIKKKFNFEIPLRTVSYYLKEIKNE